MKKTAALFLSIIGLTASAKADQKATITCTSEKIVLIETSPYLGENSKFSQSLFTLRSNDVGSDQYTAYFLDVDLEGDVDAHSMILTVGTNNKGGQFTLKTKFWTDVGDGTTINEQTTGLISYNHGPLKGKDEKVNCVKK